jgi:predicted RecA/RadA family phage recombinase
MAKNKLFENGRQLSFAAPAGVVSGQPVMPGGTLAGVASADVGAGTATAPDTVGLVAVDLEGVYLLPVTGVTVLSPASGSAVNSGDLIYADTDGMTDSVTGMYTGFTLTKNSSGKLFGTAVPGPTIAAESKQLIASGQTATIGVRLKGQAS